MLICLFKCLTTDVIIWTVICDGGLVKIIHKKLAAAVVKFNISQVKSFMYYTVLYVHADSKKAWERRPKMTWRTLIVTVVSGNSTRLTLVIGMCGDPV